MPSIEQIKNTTKHVLQEVVGGNFLSIKTIRSFYGLVLFLFVIAIIFIGSRYHYQREQRHKRELILNIRDLRDQYVAKSASLMKMKRESVVADSVQEYLPDLHSPKTASFIITQE